MLLKPEPKLANVTVVGTDGEQAILQVLKAVFSEKILIFGASFI